MSFHKVTPDELLIKQIQSGDREALKEIFLNYYSVLTRFAYYYVNSQAIAEDIVQDVFASIWEERRTWSPERTIRVYLYIMVKNRCLDFLKHKRVEDKYNEDWVHQSGTHSSNTDVFSERQREEQLNKVVKQAIETLPERAKMIYKLNRQDGLTYSEIADLLDVSEKTVESQMSRSLKKLRDKLKPYLSLLLLSTLPYMETVMSGIIALFLMLLIEM